LRVAALVVGFLAFPLIGAGLALLGRLRRFGVWAAVGAVVWTLMIISIRAPVPKLAPVAIVGLYAILLFSLAATAVAKRGDARRGLGPWLLAIALIGAGKGTGILSRWQLVEAFQMPSGSMIPTLLVGDHMFVKKGRSGITRGDVLVFKYPLDQTTDYIKRVVAIGGDTVEVNHGVVSINGTPLDQQPIEGACKTDFGDPSDGDDGECKLMRETNGGRIYTILLYPGHPATDYPPTKVPPGELFMIGDNRDNSYDSRRWGTVREDLVKGQATVIWWSRGPGSPLNVRWSRVGHGIE
jgi:signal peptidase I